MDVLVKEDPDRPDPNYCRLLTWQGRDPDWSFWHKLAIDNSEAPRILELGSGCGNLSIPLAESGLCVTALDNDPNVVAQMRKTAGSIMQVVHADMRDFDLKQTFSLIILKSLLLNMFSPGERSATMASVRRHMAPSALFATEVYQLRWLRQRKHFKNQFQEIICLKMTSPGIWRVRGRYFDGEKTYVLTTDAGELSKLDLRKLASAHGLRLRGGGIERNPITEIVLFEEA